MAVTVPSFAKINLDLRVLNRRQDGFHELRTIFQTISLKDTLTVEAQIARRTQIELNSSVQIENNLVVRAAEAVLKQIKVRARVAFTLSKNIPMGAGLGGGSSNAAAVLLALPELLQKQIPYAESLELAESLGSDVPFFLRGGTSLGIGRGSEFYALPDQPARSILIVASGIHVSTAEAYRSLNRSLTSIDDSPILREFQQVVQDLNHPGTEPIPLRNDFERAVFASHPALSSLLRKLRRSGANPARMTGSGSALFGIFASDREMRAAAALFPAGIAYPARFVSRRQYAAAWRRALA